jgi:hypothetical protein
VTSPTRFSIAAAGIALLFSSLMAAAQNAPPNPPQGARLGFDQYKAQQLQQMKSAQAFVAERLAAPDLPPEQRQRLEHRQAQLGRFGTLPPEQQDRLLHRRFERMDVSHDGVLDPSELQAFRQAQRDRAQTKRDAGGVGGNNDDFWPSPN